MTMGAALGFVAVALGAFGAHGLEDLLKSNGREGTWDTAVLYQFVHVGLLLVFGLMKHAGHQGKSLEIATWTTVAGIFIFSGSLYLLSITNIKWLGAITPIGGVCFLCAWVLLFFHSLKTKSNV